MVLNHKALNGFGTQWQNSDYFFVVMACHQAVLDGFNQHFQASGHFPLTSAFDKSQQLEINFWEHQELNQGEKQLWLIFITLEGLKSENFETPLSFETGFQNCLTSIIFFWLKSGRNLDRKGFRPFCFHLAAVTISSISLAVLPPALISISCALSLSLSFSAYLTYLNLRTYRRTHKFTHTCHTHRPHTRVH